MTSVNFTEETLKAFTEAVTEKVIAALVGNAELVQSGFEGHRVGLISFFGALEGATRALALFALETGKFETAGARMSLAASIGSNLLSAMDDWEEFLKSNRNPYFTIERIREIN